MAAGQALWGLLNYRPPVVTRPPEDQEEVQLFGGGSGFVRFRWTRSVGSRVTSNCSTGQTFSGVFQDGGSAEGQSGFVVARSVVVGTTEFIRQLVCEGSGFDVGTPTLALGYRNAAGDLVGLVGANVGAVSRGMPFSGTNETRYGNFRTEIAGNVAPVTVSEAPQLPEAVRPPLPPLLPAVAPGRAPAPAPGAPEPAPVPGEAQPLPVPVPVPGGLPGGSPSRPPALRPGPTVTPGRGTGTGQSAGQPITAGGVRPQLPPAPGPTATGTTVMPGGQQLAPNGPRPTPQAMATELGKLEQKLELALAPDGPLSLLELLNKVIDQVENIEFLIERLFPPEPYQFPAGAYQLTPVCDRDPDGVLLPPLQAPWAGGEGEFAELRQRLDALAQLLQHHKTLKQPTCGGRGSGPASNVTVHFESD